MKRPPAIFGCSMLVAVITMTGWGVLGLYLIYDYAEHGPALLEHFSATDLHDMLMHGAVLAAPIISSLLGYLVGEREKLMAKSQAAEKKLGDAVLNWRGTFDSMPYGVMLLDENGSIIKANEHVAKLCGVKSPRMLLRSNCSDAMHGEGGPPECCPLKKARATLDTETSEFFDTARGKWLKLIASPMVSDNGLFFVHSIIDISDLKEKELKLSESKAAFFNMLKDLDSSFKDLKSLYSGLIFAFADALDAKSPWTKGHSERVTAFSLAIAREMGLGQNELETLKTAALLHDIGKIGTYDVILDKPGRLTEEEFELVKRHPGKGADFLKHIKQMGDIHPIIRHHHERVDGSGYPDRLTGEEIPMLARILCAADSFDSMTADRPYRAAPGREFAISELKRCSGSQFDPQVVDAFLSVLKAEDAKAA